MLKSQNKNPLDKLRELHKQIVSNIYQNYSEKIKQYIRIYIQNHQLSEQFFYQFCEQDALSLLYKLGKSNNLVIWQCYNLLLVNTHNISQLGYILSQAQVHSILFDYDRVLNQNSEELQYYIQLLKTILKKIESTKDHSFIKLFCNCRSPSFPLLTIPTIICSPGKNDGLARVTAKQCILIAIGLLYNKIGQAYLYQLQMIIFYYQICSDLEDNQQYEENIHYIMDLMKALLLNQVALFLLVNCLVNTILVKWIYKLFMIIRTLDKLINFAINDQSVLLRNTFLDIVQTIILIISKYKFDKFLDDNYYANIVINREMQLKLPENNSYKIYQEHYQKINLNLNNAQKQQLNYQSIQQRICKYFLHQSNEIIKIKQKYYNKVHGTKSSILHKLWNRLSDPFLCKISDLVGIKLQVGKEIILQSSLNLHTALFIVEHSFQKKKCEKNTPDRKNIQIHTNEWKGQFQLSKQFLQRVLTWINSTTNQKQHQLSHQLQPKINYECFLERLKEYLQNQIYKLCKTHRFHNPKEILFLSKICLSLKLNIEKNDEKNLKKQIRESQNNLRKIIEQNGVNTLIQYIYGSYQDKLTCKQKNYNEEKTKKQLIEIIAMENQQKQLFQLQKSKQFQNKELSELLLFQLMRILLKYKTKSLKQCVKQIWKIQIGKIKNTQITLSVLYYGKKCQLRLQHDFEDLVVLLKVIQNKKILKQIKINEQTIKVSHQNSCQLYFGQDKECVILRSTNQSNQLIKSYNKVKIKITQMFTEGIKKYLEQFKQ